MSPAWKVVRPMTVARSVVFPTPFRPSTASELRSRSTNATSSRTTVSPYPARTPARLSASAMPLPEVDLVHAPVGADLGRRSLAQYLALHQYRDPLREAEHDVHVVLDDEDRDVGRQRVEHLQDPLRFERRHAGRGLVEQQHLGLEPERDGDFDQALLAVRQVDHAHRRVGVQSQAREQRHCLVADVAMRARRAPRAAGDAAAFRDTERDIVEHRQIPEERVDLEGSADAALHARLLREPGDVLAAEQDPPRRRSEPAGEHVHEGRLAGPVGADQRVPRARLQPEVDVVRDRQGAEALAQAARFEHGAHRCGPLTPATSRSTRPSKPPRANITTRTSSSPIPKYQYSGKCLASWSCAIM